MEIGILSDTHNDKEMTERALEVFRQRGIRTLFHCGDVAAADLVSLFRGFEVTFVRGNMDRRYVKALQQAIGAQSDMHWLSTGGEVTLEGKRIAVTHGDHERVFEDLLFSEPDYLLTGHTHRRRDERVGLTRIINPGALGGTQHESRSVGILDLATDRLEVVTL
jgi:putative phosphoesterase